MANRVIRDWTTSDSMDKLSSGGEVFFTRLIMKADDFGSYFANPKLLKSGLFPLKDISEATVKGWIHECVSAGLIFKYTVDKKEYLRIENFGQRLRNMRNAFPHPVDNLRQVAANCGELPPETKRNEVETETESEVETETNGACDLKDLDSGMVTKAADLTEAICKYFSVKTIVLSPKYNKVCDFVTTAAHKNELNIVANILTKYMAYKARSQEQTHSVESWIGTKQNHYQDGQWTMTDWISKEQNYKQPNERIKGISGQSGPEPGKDYRRDGGF
jgi:hypothetical protein